MIIKRNTYSILFIILAISLLVLPFITTFNELLTKAVETSRLYKPIQALIVPFLVRMISLILSPFALQPQVTNDSIILFKNAQPLSIYISWNCIGWQSLILLFISLITGLQGSYQLSAKLTCIAAGIIGTFWVNLLRITLVIVVAYFVGQVPAILFHDYFSTLLIIGWLLMFWKVSFKYILY